MRERSTSITGARRRRAGSPGTRCTRSTRRSAACRTDRRRTARCISARCRRHTSSTSPIRPAWRWIASQRTGRARANTARHRLDPGAGAPLPRPPGVPHRSRHRRHLDCGRRRDRCARRARGRRVLPLGGLFIAAGFVVGARHSSHLPDSIAVGLALLALGGLVTGAVARRRAWLGLFGVALAAPGAVVLATHLEVASGRSAAAAVVDRGARRRQRRDRRTPRRELRPPLRCSRLAVGAVRRHRGRCLRDGSRHRTGARAARRQCPVAVARLAGSR